MLDIVLVYGIIRAYQTTPHKTESIMFRYFLTLKKTHGRGQMISQYFDTEKQAKDSMDIVIRLDRGVMFAKGEVKQMLPVGTG